MDEDYQEIFQLARPYLQTRENELHTRVAYCYAKRLLDAEGGDPEIVLPAVILHDIGWWTIPEELHVKAFGPGVKDMALNRRHEVEGARIAAEILAGVACDPIRREEIVSIILGHDSRTEAQSLNDAIVKDADKLWRFSEEGLEIHPKLFGIAPDIHTVWLGQQIANWFFTETARQIAIEEHKFRAISFGMLPHATNPEAGNES
jgi:HD superfamily phosphodiesterase